VAANRRLRELTAERADAAGLELFVPPPKLCTDNAAMIGAAGSLWFKRGDRSRHDLDADPALVLS
jgi:N6-L-threonylcarbamoyladenine synthase